MGFIFLRHHENKITLGQQGLGQCFVELPTHAISVSLTIETHKDNTDTFRVTNKQYYKIILFLKFLSNKTDIFRELLPNTSDFFQENCTR